ncbi:hypothetical protein RCL1_008313 [Eukaryota sp. TZLM3-RCL]
MSLERSIVPKVNDIVFAQVLRVNRRSANVLILGNQTGVYPDKFPAILRQRDVRSFNPDAVDMYKSFRPGDVIVARVLSIGDTRAYYLTTDGDEFGVTFALSEAGHVLIPISWEQMQCSETNKLEERKVAKPVSIST